MKEKRKTTPLSPSKFPPLINRLSIFPKFKTIFVHLLSKKVVILHSINYATLKSLAAVGKPICCANISATMKHLFSRSLILFASTLVSLFIATQSAWGADAVVSGPIYANATANYYPHAILRAGSGEQCLDVTANTDATLSETFSDGTVLYSVDSNGRPMTGTK